MPAALPASVLVTDYNYDNPAAPVQGEQPVSPAGRGQVRDYGYRVFDEGEARLRVQMSAAHQDAHIDRALEAFARLKQEIP